ncbi:MAG TPA: SMP-30/gluconolactonase/LRE family protein [Noviherbaspirillum sp.]|uniref:SMP-30/gluconolactonase/LRE family protein n=1 Tax=Noviherbaspirillum sp. TaxID=1926288 RepID=UPI002D337F6F|nr:SMP-30/gluconolactonase/LRE family protein [Noviherbaspirillum sp.]HYD96851.1 SMP-30/gluconolactonase/LRE family protein [Noviherbaspirillum sp.]
MLRKALAALFVLILLLAGYLTFAPVPIAPQAWNAPVDAGYAGPFAVNHRLAELRYISLGAESGPEHVAPGPDGLLYAAVAGGKILRMQADGSALEVWAQTGGRVLGFDFDRRGNVVAADSIKGLLLIEAPAGAATAARITVLADKVRVDGIDDPIRFADAVTVAQDGRIYFTDASRRFGAAQWGEFDASILDIMEHSATGRVLVYDPQRQTVEVVAHGLSFANGIALSADEKALFVAETGAYRIWKVAASARNLDLKAGSGNGTQASVLLANLPGYPDNLLRGRDGRIWAGLAKPRSAVADKLAAHPFLRSMAARLPKALWPLPPSYGHVFAFDETGRVTADLQDPGGKYPETTGVTETADRLYIQSLHAPRLGWLPKEGRGL